MTFESIFNDSRDYQMMSSKLSKNNMKDATHLVLKS